jgi:hypothetical protein
MADGESTWTSETSIGCDSSCVCKLDIYFVSVKYVFVCIKFMCVYVKFLKI